MTKHFCDKCSDEITEKNECNGGNVVGSRLGTTIKFRPKGRLIIDPEDRFTVEILTSFNGTANAGEFCKYCVLDALYKLDDRPHSR